MRSHAWLTALAILVGCSPDDGNGTQIGALKEGSVPAPPSDLVQLDLAQAVEEAVRIAGVTTMATAWAAHVDSMAEGTASCPTAWLGAPPEDFVEIDGVDEDQPGLSWADFCTTAEGTSFEGFAFWQNVLAPDLSTGSRALVMDGVVADAQGEVLLDFDGEASDDLEGGTYRSSLVARTLSGSLLGLGSGLRAELEPAQWGSNVGDVELQGQVHLFDGFGPADTRSGDLEESPELTNVTDWEPGSPRFTSVRYDIDFGGDCELEPVGYLGVRGNEGFWFDIYFLPQFSPDDGSAEAGAYPFEAIENTACDGKGTLFVRNLDLRAVEEASPGWSREIEIDFGAILSEQLPTPSTEGYVFTLQHLPREDTP